jgi:hypothetical protein
MRIRIDGYSHVRLNMAIETLHRLVTVSLLSLIVVVYNCAVASSVTIVIVDRLFTFT